MLVSFGESIPKTRFPYIPLSSPHPTFGNLLPNTAATVHQSPLLEIFCLTHPSFANATCSQGLRVVPITAGIRDTSQSKS